MGIRSYLNLAVQLGVNNSLDPGSLVGELDAEQVVDTLASAQSVVGELAANELNTPIPFGDITTAQLIAIEASGDLDIYLGGTAPTVAEMTAVGAVYPTGFVGGETLDLEIDGIAFTTTFLVGDQSLANVVNRLNAEAAYNGLDGFVAFASGGQLKLRSLVDGSTSQVNVVGGTAVATLGLTVSEVLGVDPTPNTSPIRLRRPADPDSSQIVDLKALAVLTVQTTSIYVSNPSLTEAVGYRMLIAGDLVAPAGC